MSYFEDLYSLLPLVIISAFVIDLLIGDPLWMPHPVRWMGRFISVLERLLISRYRRPLYNFAAGAFTAVVVVCVVFFSSLFILGAARKTSTALYIALSVYMAWTCISVRSLGDAAMSVIKGVERDDLDGARGKLSGIVGRDTQKLSGEGVLRAVVETVSENTSDGVVAPLFYLALGGPAFSLAYKAVNTLDSMVGYRDERYIHFGRFSARLDDLANYIPARITAVLLILSAFISGEDWRGSLKILKRDGRASPSPNAGLPQAATAGALGVRLGGTAYYRGVENQKPFIGDGVKGVDISGAKKAVKMMYVTALFTALLAVLFHAALSVL